MTHDQLKWEIDDLDTGLPDRLAFAPVKQRGLTLRRRRRATAGVVGLAAAVLIAVPFAVGVGSSQEPIGDYASDPSAGPASAEPTVEPTSGPSDPSAPADQSRLMEEAVTEVLGSARLVDDRFFDSKVVLDNGVVDVALGDPPDWDSVFLWNQDYAVGDLQYFTTSTSWEAAVPGSQACDEASYVVEKDCQVSELASGYTLVLREGVRLSGEADGEWSRRAEVVSPASEGGLVQRVLVLAQTEGASWSEAKTLLPALEDLGRIAADPRMRLREPTTLPEPE